MQIFCSHFGSFFWVYAFSVYIFAHIWFSWSSLLPDEFLVCCLFLGLVCVRGHLTKRDGKNSHRYNCSSFSIPSWKSFQTYKSIYILLIWCCFMFFSASQPQAVLPQNMSSVFAAQCSNMVLLALKKLCLWLLW